MLTFISAEADSITSTATDARAAEEVWSVVQNHFCVDGGGGDVEVPTPR